MVDAVKVLFFKKEATYATDAGPTGAVNAALTRNFTAKPVVVDRIQRNLDRPVRGSSKDAPSNERQTYGYELELAGSGTAGTAPAWMEHLEACGMAAPVLTANTSAVQRFAPIGAARRTAEAEAEARRNSFAVRSMGQQFGDFGLQAITTGDIVRSFTQQMGQMGYAMSEMSGRAGKVGAFLTGPWGIALTVGAAVVLPFVQNLFKAEEAAEAAKIGANGLAEAQGVLGGMFDLTSGKLKKQNELLILNARLTALNLRGTAAKERDSARETFGNGPVGPAAAAGRVAMPACGQRARDHRLDSAQPDRLALAGPGRCAAGRGGRALSHHHRRPGGGTHGARLDRRGSGRNAGDDPADRNLGRLGPAGRNHWGGSMMTNETPRWTLPLLAAGQAQKEMTHNEALSLLDLVVHPCVEAVGLNGPPVDPRPGQAWIIGDQPSGDWTGRAAMLAGWTEGGWRFLVPLIGLSVWSRADDCRCDWDGNQWRLGRVVGRSLTIEGKKVVGPQRPGIAQPVGGQVIDSEARLALNAVISALRDHGLVASG